MLGGLLLAGCGGKGPEETPAVRLVDRFDGARLEGDPGPLERPEPVVWRFGSAAGEAASSGTWAAGPGLAGLEVRDEVLAGRTDQPVALIDLRPPTLPEGGERLHAVEIRMRASAGSYLYLRFSSSAEPNLAALAAQPPDLVWRTRTPLVPGDESRTYVVRSPGTVEAGEIRHLLLRPTDVPGAEFEIESVRLVFLEEHLAGLASGLGWHGLSEVYREALLVRSPQSLRFDLTLPERPFLHLAVGTPADEAATFRVSLSRPGEASSPDGRPPVFEHAVTESGRWHEEVIDLGIAAGERVEVTLALDAARPGAVGLWGNPVVRSHAPEPWRGSEPGDGPPLGVILVVADTLRQDRLEAYGGDRETSPAISRLAEEGVLFRDAQAEATWTKAAVPSLLTSLYPTSHGVLKWDDRLPSSALTLAELYREAGYATLSLSSIFFTGMMSNLHQGFEVVHEAGSLDARPPTKTARACVDRLLPWLERHREVPFFVLLHMFDPHFPYRPLPPHDTRWTEPPLAADHLRDVQAVRPFIADPFLRAVGLPTAEELAAAGLAPDDYVAQELAWYDGSIYAMDQEIGRLLDHLETLGLAGRVLVVLVSDHGEEFLEHGRMFHGQSVFGELTNVPLIFWRPGALPAGAEVAETVQTIDVMPTLAELSGLEVPATLQGNSLVPLLGGAGRPSAGERRAPRPAFSEKNALDDVLGPPPRETASYAVVWDGWKLVHHVRGEERPEYQLFDHLSDPLDRRDVAEQHPEVVERLAELLRRWRERVERERLPDDATVAPELSAAELERLRALGYL